MSKAEVERIAYEEKVHLLVGKISPKELSSTFILLCRKENINVKEVDMVAKIASKGKVIKTFVVAYMMTKQDIVSLDSSDDENGGDTNGSNKEKR